MITNKMDNTHLEADFGVGAVAAVWAYSLYHTYAVLKGYKTTTASSTRSLVRANVIFTIIGSSTMLHLIYYADKFGKHYLEHLSDEQIVKFNEIKPSLIEFHQNKGTSIY